MATVACIYLTGNETLEDLKALGLTNSGSRSRARQRGYFRPLGNTPVYPQAEGDGGFAALASPYRYIRAILYRMVRSQPVPIDDMTLEDWTQELLLHCWERRHDPDIRNHLNYYGTMVRALVRQWIARYRTLHYRYGITLEEHHR